MKRFLRLVRLQDSSYLLKNVDLTKKSKQRFWLEAVIFTLILVIGFVLSSTTFKLTGYEAEFTYIDKNEQLAKIEYNYPPLFGMHEYESLTPDAMTPWAEMPPIVNAKTLTTFVWSVASWNRSLLDSQTHFPTSGCGIVPTFR